LSDFSIPVRVRETHGLSRTAEAIRTGIPLPLGLVTNPLEVRAQLSGHTLPFQARPLAFWGDRSVKWLLVDVIVPVDANTEATIELSRADGDAQTGIHVSRTESHLMVDTGAALFEIPIKGSRLLDRVVTATGADVLGEKGAVCQLSDKSGHRFSTQTNDIVVEEEGPVRVVLLATGGFSGAGPAPPVVFTARMSFIAGSAALQLEFKLWNPEPALHAGGLWDLGDPGSYLFRDLSIICHPAKATALRWYSEDPANPRQSSVQSWSLYQDSSGGERWNSPNHVDCNNRSTVSFRGYRVTEGSDGDSPVVVSSGHRATPGVATVGETSIAVAVRDFWQSFPKALRWRDSTLQIGLFPQECAAGFELQGGEQKRHVLFFDFAPNGTGETAFQHPVEATLDAEWVERSGAISMFTAASTEDDPEYQNYINQIVSGPNSFFAKREIIDEYGWRNFGDLYADHEAVHHKGPEPFISHYNNQYDFIYGAFLHHLRTGEPRWRELMLDAARHSIDIDIYRTQGDKAAFNGGLFWHTDHYKPAATSTHRTYSKKNSGAGSYGGGPADEQDYSSGFLACYYLTGDAEAAAAVCTLADWVCMMDDGSRTLFALIDEGPTGFASASRDSSYHGPGRGAGNSINTLMDAYSVTGNRRYWFKAEELIRRCVHPADDIPSRHLDDPENRWSYLVFFQILGKYLAQKLEQGESDYMFWYARASLLHYARWMLEHEVPYKDVLHKVELPTETWPAHDIRKCHILYLAGRYARADEDISAYTEKAELFFRRCLQDLTGFPTAHFTRPLVILSVYGGVREYFRRFPGRVRLTANHAYSFGTPGEFKSQRDRLASTLKRKSRLLREELMRVARQKFRALLSR